MPAEGEPAPESPAEAVPSPAERPRPAKPGRRGRGRGRGAREPEAETVEAEAEKPETPPATGRHRDRVVESLNIANLQAMSMTDLNNMAKNLGVENFGTMRKHEVIFHILQKNAEREGVLFSEGVLEVLPEGFGFLRSQSFNYLPCPEDIYVSPSQIRRFDLQTGNRIAGQIRPPKEKERFFALLKVEAVDGEDPDKAKDKTHFDNLTPLFPDKRLVLALHLLSALALTTATLWPDALARAAGGFMMLAHAATLFFLVRTLRRARRFRDGLPSTVCSKEETQ